MDPQSPFVVEWRSLVAVGVILSVGSVATSAGVGGGAIFIPLLQALVGFGLKDSTALSQALITAGSLVSVAINLFKRSPTNPDTCLINFDLALALTPVVLSGVSAGVVLNTIFPPWLVTLLLMVLMLLLVTQAISKGLAMWHSESAQRMWPALLAPHTPAAEPATAIMAATKTAAATPPGTPALYHKGPHGPEGAQCPDKATAGSAGSWPAALGMGPGTALGAAVGSASAQPVTPSSPIPSPRPSLGPHLHPHSDLTSHHSQPHPHSPGAALSLPQPSAATPTKVVNGTEPGLVRPGEVGCHASAGPPANAALAAIIQRWGAALTPDACASLASLEGSQPPPHLLASSSSSNQPQPPPPSWPQGRVPAGLWHSEVGADYLWQLQQQQQGQPGLQGQQQQQEALHLLQPPPSPLRPAQQAEQDRQGSGAQSMPQPGADNPLPGPPADSWESMEGVGTPPAPSLPRGRPALAAPSEGSAPPLPAPPAALQPGGRGQARGRLPVLAEHQAWEGGPWHSSALQQEGAVEEGWPWGRATAPGGGEGHCSRTEAETLPAAPRHRGGVGGAGRGEAGGGAGPQVPQAGGGLEGLSWVQRRSRWRSSPAAQAMLPTPSPSLDPHPYTALPHGPSPPGTMPGTAPGGTEAVPSTGLPRARPAPSPPSWLQRRGSWRNKLLLLHGFQELGGVPAGPAASLLQRARSRASASLIAVEEGGGDQGVDGQGSARGGLAQGGASSAAGAAALQHTVPGVEVDTPTAGHACTLGGPGSHGGQGQGQGQGQAGASGSRGMRRELPSWLSAGERRSRPPQVQGPLAAEDVQALLQLLDSKSSAPPGRAAHTTPAHTRPGMAGGEAKSSHQGQAVGGSSSGGQGEVVARRQGAAGAGEVGASKGHRGAPRGTSPSSPLSPSGLPSPAVSPFLSAQPAPPAPLPAHTCLSTGPRDQPGAAAAAAPLRVSSSSDPAAPGLGPTAGCGGAAAAAAGAVTSQGAQPFLALNIGPGEQGRNRRLAWRVLWPAVVTELRADWARLPTRPAALMAATWAVFAVLQVLRSLPFVPRCSTTYWLLLAAQLTAMLAISCVQAAASLKAPPQPHPDPHTTPLTLGRTRSGSVHPSLHQTGGPAAACLMQPQGDPSRARSRSGVPSPAPSPALSLGPRRLSLRRSWLQSDSLVDADPGSSLPLIHHGHLLEGAGTPGHAAEEDGVAAEQGQGEGEGQGGSSRALTLPGSLKAAGCAASPPTPSPGPAPQLHPDDLPRPSGTTLASLAAAAAAGETPGWAGPGHPADSVPAAPPAKSGAGKGVEHQSAAPNLLGESAAALATTLSTACLAGLMGGLLGLGGGMVVGPLLLQLGVQPQVASATSSLMVLFSSSAALLSFAVVGRLNVPYALVFGAASMASSVLGVLVVGSLVRRSGRPSLVVFSLALVMLTGLACITAFGIGTLRAAFTTGEGLGFNDLCA